jgi:hypothetical protein
MSVVSSKASVAVVPFATCGAGVSTLLLHAVIPIALSAPKVPNAPIAPRARSRFPAIKVTRILTALRFCRVVMPVHRAGFALQTITEAQEYGGFITLICMALDSHK